jgi:hypothetical protein
MWNLKMGYPSWFWEIGQLVTNILSWGSRKFLKNGPMFSNADSSFYFNPRCKKGEMWNQIMIQKSRLTFNDKVTYIHTYKRTNIWSVSFLKLDVEVLCWNDAKGNSVCFQPISMDRVFRKFPGILPYYNKSVLLAYGTLVSFLILQSMDRTTRCSTKLKFMPTQIRPII